ncbi:MAG: hypothetical protein IT371_15030 [Deltaproteobacteria bacterium]|nr:hypothetical protein [Deltaproteobacteria bacterium]
MRRLGHVMTVAVALGALGCPPPPPAYPPPPGGGPVGTRPHPMDDRPGGFAELEYLTAEGRGTTEMLCEQDARGNLAKIFISQIQQVSTDWQGHFSKVGPMGSMRVEAMSVSQITQVATDKTLQGTRVVHRGAAPEGGVKCLGVLERAPVEANLRSEIDRLDGEIGTYLRAGDAATSATDKFMNYKNAMLAMQRREALNVDLRIVNSRGVGKPPPTDWGALVAKFTSAKGKIKIGLIIQGTEARKIQTCMAEELTKQDISVIEGSSDVDIMVHGQLKYARAGYVLGSEMVRADINLRLADIENGKTLAAFTDYVKVGRPELQQSVQLAVARLCMQAVPQLVSKVRAALRR